MMNQTQVNKQPSPLKIVCLTRTVKWSKQYGWIDYQQLPSPNNHFWLVLRSIGVEYVVHLFNSQDGGHYYGTYCRDYETAKKRYFSKLASYLLDTSL